MNETLPIEGALLGHGREQFEKLGFVFGNRISEKLTSVQFPQGWRRVNSLEIPLTKVIIDQKGRKRATITYDANRNMQPQVRLSRRLTYTRFGSTPYRGVLEVLVRDFGGRIKSMGTCLLADDQYSYILESNAHIWLDEQYPHWENPLAYWDIEIPHEDVPELLSPAEMAYTE